MTDEPRKPPHPDEGEYVSIDEADAAVAPFCVADLMMVFHKPHHHRHGGDRAVAGIVAVPHHDDDDAPNVGFAALGDHTEPDEDYAIGFALTGGGFLAAAWMSPDTARSLMTLIQHAVDQYETGRVVNEVVGRQHVDPEPPILLEEPPTDD